MKLISYQLNNQYCYGIITNDGVIDLTSRIGKQFPTLKALLAANQLDLARSFLNDSPDFSENEISYLPVIVNPAKIICVGMNYAAKRVEFDETNPAPTLFIRFADSQTGHKSSVIKPAATQEFDYEGELAVIIGRPGIHIQQQTALDHVAGYSCYMDGSVRDWQHNWFTAGKNWPKTGAFGPCLTTTDDIPDPSHLTLHTYLNGQKVQDDNTVNLIHSIPELIAYISCFTYLSAGDVIITGSPGGVGKKRVPPLFMKAGDLIEVEIEKIGRLSNTVVDEVLDQASRDSSSTAIVG